MVTTPAKVWARIAPANERGCMEWQGAVGGNGYGHVGYLGRVERVHRLTYEWAYGNPDNLNVLHQCDNPRCCNPLHLFLGTPADNAADKARKGRTGREKRFGERNGKAKLTEFAVREILTSPASGGALARKFGVSRALVNMVRRKEIWSHINV